MRKFSLVIILLLVFAIAVFPGDQARKRKPMAGPTNIGFIQSFGPYAGFTLAGNFSKMKTYLENEFGATVTAVTSGLTNLSGYDLIIIPARFSQRPSTADTSALRSWIQAGGVVIQLWYPLQPKDVGSDRDWGGDPLRVMYQDHYDMWFYSTPNSGLDITSIANPYNSNPYVANYVQCGVSTARAGKNSGIPKDLCWSNGSLVGLYYDNAGSGKIYLIGNTYCFQNAYIDNQDNLDFLYNIIHNAFGNGGGGGTDQSNLAVLKVKAKNYLASPGDTILFKVRVKNKSKVPTDACKVGIYLSPDKVWDASDIKLGEGDVPALGKRKGKLVKKSLILPLTLAAGNYYIIGYVDEAGVNDDKDTTNNTKSSTKAIQVL